MEKRSFYVKSYLVTQSSGYKTDQDKTWNTS